jgi:hypothetical protein
MATAAFLARWLTSTRDAAILLKVELTDPSAQTLYLTNRYGVATPGSPPRYWQPLLEDVGPVSHQGSLGSFDPVLATFECQLAPNRLSYQAAGLDARDAFATFYWLGARVTLYQWEMALTDFADANQIFSGVMIDYQSEAAGIHIFCQQPTDWIVRVPSAEVTRQKYPRAPEKSIGLPAGAVCYGDGRTLPCRDTPGISGTISYGTFNQSLVGVFGLRRAFVRGVVVDLGKGAGSKGRVLFANHACKLWNNDSGGSTPALMMGDRVGEMDPASGEDFNGAGGTGFTYDDVTNAGVQPFDCFFPVLPIDSKKSAANQGDNARAATDGFNDTSYAELDFSGGKLEILIPLPDVSPMGLYVSAKDVYGWSTSAGIVAVLKADFTNPGAGGGHTATLANTGGLNTKIGAGASIVSGTPSSQWNFGSDGCYLRVYLVGGAAGDKARIYFAGLAIKYRPSWPVYAPAYKVQIPGAEDYRVAHRWMPGLPGKIEIYKHRYSHQPHDQWFPATEQVTDGQYFAALQGYADDGGGTYTGVANALIELPTDVIRHFLAVQCAQSAFETGGVRGSFVDERAHFVTWRGSSMKLAISIPEFRDSSGILRDLAGSALCWVYISRLTGKWKIIPWRIGSATNWTRKLTRWDLMDPAGPKMILHRDQVINDLTCSYDYDANGKQYISETFVAAERSGSGHLYRSLRDENTTVIASESDRLDFNDSGGNKTANLTPAAYAPIDLANHVATQMSAVATRGYAKVAYGFVIKTGYNDTVYVSDGASFTVTLPAGNYTGAALAAALQAALNLGSTNWVVTYSLATLLFTIGRSSGTCQLLWGTAVAGALFAGMDVVLGFEIKNYTGSASYAGAFMVEPERFAIALLTDNLKLLFETGTNGIDAATPRTCGALLGFDTARDWDLTGSSVGAKTFAVAHSPKNARELEVATSIARYGKRPGTVMSLRAVNDTDTAREVRNRNFDIWKQAVVEIQFETERMPDVDLGDVIEFDSSIDDVQPFGVPGTNGSWASKRFIVTSIVQHSLPTVHQEIAAFWDSASA